MGSTNSPTQAVQASGQKQPEPCGLTLNMHIYDVSSVQERLLSGAATTPNSSETVNGTATSSARLKLLKDQIIDFDLIMGTSSAIPSRL